MAVTVNAPGLARIDFVLQQRFEQPVCRPALGIRLRFGVQMTADLGTSALNMALHTRRPESVIHHSDQGSQYTSIAFGNRCREMGVRPSLGSVGDAYDNAMAESFFATLECELIARRSWRTKTEARLAVFTWIESWYNPHRRHAALNYLSPNNFERKHHNNTINAETQITPELH